MPLFIYRAINIIFMFYNMLCLAKSLVYWCLKFYFLALSESILYFSIVSILRFAYIYVGK